MPLKKQTFSEDEVEIFDEAVIYKRGEYWQMRMWLAKEKKYARFSLKTRNRSTAIDKAKLHYHELKAGELAGKRYFSLTTKAGVELYLARREKDVDPSNKRGITKGRYNTIKTHLEHWLDFIHRDTKLKELERTDCDEYALQRNKKNKKTGLVKASITTIANEQSTINAMMRWLFKRNETLIEGFDFPRADRIDRGIDENRRNTFTRDEVYRIHSALNDYIKNAFDDLHGEGNIAKIVGGCYLGFSLISGLRRGEQMQLLWSDLTDTNHILSRKNKYDLVRIKVRAEITKVRKSRIFVVKDPGYVSNIFKLRRKLENITTADAANDYLKNIQEQFIFSSTGKSSITPRAIGYHFEKIMELAKVDRALGRNLVPYSFRHYFITEKVNSNLPPASIAEMCGTSITQIEKTYYHTSIEKMISNAVADYEYKNGVLMPKLD